MIVRLPTVHWGDGDRRALLVHGLTSSSRVWWRVGSELADRGWSVTAVDLRGHGDAPPANDYSIHEAAGDLLGLEGPWEVAVGHSVGGTTVLTAGQNTGWADRLVLVDPLLVIDPASRAALVSEVVRELGLTAELLRQQHPDWHPDDVFWKVWSARQVSPDVVGRFLTDTDPFDTRSLLETVPVPTTILAADPRHGALVDVADTRVRTADNPRVQLVELEGVGHSVFRQRPQDVVAAVVT